MYHNMIRRYHFTIIILLVLSASICFGLSFGSGPQSLYCKTEDDILCKKCPKNADCQKFHFKDFECKNGTLKNKEQCLITSMPNEKLRRFHVQIINLRKNQIKDHSISLEEVAKHFGISFIDAKAAILYDEDFLLNSNDIIIKKPAPLNTTRIRFIFFILSVVLVLVLISPKYDKYGSCVLFILFYFFTYSIIDKLIKGLF